MCCCSVYASTSLFASFSFFFFVSFIVLLTKMRVSFFCDDQIHARARVAGAASLRGRDLLPVTGISFGGNGAA